MLMPTSQRNFGANEKVLAMRIKAVGNIGKITKAMKMVAAAKMRGDLVRLQNGRRFGINGIDMMFKADPAMMRKSGEMPADPKELLVPLSSDRGLCGGINSGIFRHLRAYLANKDHSKVKIFALGDKGAAAMKRPFPDMLTMGISDIQSPYNYPMCMSVGEHIVKNSSDVDRIRLYYNEFKSAIAYEIREVPLMPKHRFVDISKSGNLYFKMAIPDKNLAVPALYELYISSNLWVAFLNNSAAEQSSRMTAMENASKNAGEIVQALKLKYNYARQARITTELCEIISGASAME